MANEVAETPFAGSPAYRGVERTQLLPACKVSISELKRLYRELQMKNDELFAELAKEQQVTPERTKEQGEKNVRDNLRVTIVARGHHGEQVVSYDDSGLRDDHLPAKLTSIQFDSAWIARILGATILNRFDVTFYFDAPKLFDFSTPTQTQNGSGFRVVAENTTWGVAVQDVVLKWLEDKQLGRGWLHRENTYDLLLIFLGLPMCIWGAWRAYSGWVIGTPIGQSPTGLGVVAAIWFFLVLLYVVRLLFGAARWMWPYVELDRKPHARGVVLRTALLGLIITLFGSFVYDVLKALLKAGS
jgi:hypothetical protein